MRFKKVFSIPYFNIYHKIVRFQTKFEKGMLYVFFICFISISLIINELAWPNTFFKNYSVFEFLNVLRDWLGKHEIGIMLIGFHYRIKIKSSCSTKCLTSFTYSTLAFRLSDHGSPLILKKTYDITKRHNYRS